MEAMVSISMNRIQHNNYMEKDAKNVGLPQLEEGLIWIEIVSFIQLRIKGNKSNNFT